MNSVSDIIARLGGSTAVAGLLGLSAATTIASWKSRKSIPVEYWPRLVDAARQRGFDEITYDSLVALHAPEPERASA